MFDGVVKCNDGGGETVFSYIYFKGVYEDTVM
jgi:hypothetical protein